MYKFTFHIDPGHGWLEVPLHLVTGLSVDISNCSYIKGNKAYLEEDCDMCKFLNVLDSEGIEYQIKDNYLKRISRIRNYYPYRSYLNL